MHFHFADPFADRDSFIHRLDPRVKVVGAVLMVIALGLVPIGSWLAYGLILLLVLLLSHRSSLGPSYPLGRAFVALPFALAAIGVLFTVPGTPVLELPGLGLQITAPGLERFVSILVRTWLAMQAAVLLMATTRFPDMLWALRALRVPGALIAILSFMYRYLFTLADEAARMIRARSARSARPEGSRRPPLRWQVAVGGAMVGALFLRALERSERVYAAMLARGYDGHPRSLTVFRMTNRDWTALLMFVIILAGMVFLVRPV